MFAYYLQLLLPQCLFYLLDPVAPVQLLQLSDLLLEDLPVLDNELGFPTLLILQPEGLLELDPGGLVGAVFFFSGIYDSLKRKVSRGSALRDSLITLEETCTPNR
jgi:hypothetical protein